MAVFLPTDNVVRFFPAAYNKNESLNSHNMFVWDGLCNVPMSYIQRCEAGLRARDV